MTCSAETCRNVLLWVAPEPVGSTPVPERVSDCGRSGELSTTTAVADSLVSVDGVKVTVSLQVPPFAATPAMHPSVILKSAEFVPEIDINGSSMAALPLLVNVKVCICGLIHTDVTEAEGGAVEGLLRTQVIGIRAGAVEDQDIGRRIR